MAGLVRIDRREAERRIAAACSTMPEVAAAFLFGSALGTCRPDSDIDVGVIAHPPAGQAGESAFGAGLRIEAALVDALGQMDDHRFDVTVLDPGRPIFSMTVIRSGHLCYVGEIEAYTDFLEHTAQGYRENAPRYWAALAEVLEEPIGGD